MLTFADLLVIFLVVEILWMLICLGLGMNSGAHQAVVATLAARAETD